MRAHSLISEDQLVMCLVCGAGYEIESYHPATCSGRTDLVHGYDCSSHSLDNCDAFDADGACEHLAINQGCDCAVCGLTHCDVFGCESKDVDSDTCDYCGKATTA